MMKLIHIYIMGTIALLAISLMACEDVNSLHQKYLDEGSKVYLGKPDSVKVKSGYKQVRLIWENNGDSKISQALITYNFGRDSVFTPFKRTQDGRQKDSITLNLEPGDYLFNISNFTESGDLQSLIATGLQGKSYGDSYQILLENRDFSVLIDGSDFIISWDYIIPYNSVYSVITHKDATGGGSKEIIVTNNEYTTIVPGVKVGDIIEVLSSYVPERFFIDAVKSTPIAMELEEAFKIYDQTKCSQRLGIPFDNTTQHSGDYSFRNMFDGNANSIWISSSPDVDPTLGGNAQNNYSYPFSFTIDLSSEIELTHLEYIGWEGLSQAPKNFEVWGTNTIVEGKPDDYWQTISPGEWQNDWYKIGTCVAEDTSKSGFKFEINSDKKKVRYLRILVKELFNPIPGNIRIGIGELMFYDQGLTYKVK